MRLIQLKLTIPWEMLISLVGRYTLIHIKSLVVDILSVDLFLKQAHTRTPGHPYHGYAHFLSYCCSQSWDIWISKALLQMVNYCAQIGIILIRSCAYLISAYRSIRKHLNSSLHLSHQSLSSRSYQTDSPISLLLLLRFTSNLLHIKPKIL